MNLVQPAVAVAAPDPWPEPLAQAASIARLAFGRDVRNLEVLSGGYQNRVWLIHSAQGACVLRCCPAVDQQRFRRRLRTAEGMRWEFDWWEALYRAGLPVPQPMTTSNGAFAYQDESGGWWNLMSYLPARTGGVPDADAGLSVMDVLAELHQVGEEVARKLGQRPGHGENLAMADWLHQCDRLAGMPLRQLLATWRTLDPRTCPVHQRPFCARLDRFEHLLGILERASRDPELESVTRTAIHADFWAMNLGFSSFSGGKVAAIYDLDDGHVDLRIHDLAIAICRSCTMPTGGLDVALGRKMVERYAHAHPLTANERRLAIPAVIAKECWYILPDLGMQWEDPEVDYSKGRFHRLEACLWHLNQQVQWNRIMAID